MSRTPLNAVPEFYARTDVIFIAVFLLIATALLFTNLDRSMLWQDEAETAGVSRTVLEHGIPNGYDGVNSFSQQGGAELGANGVWKLHPWFQYYWSAAFMLILDETTYQVRLPFALLGLGCVLMIYLCGMELFRDRRTSAFATILLLSNVFFLLLSRQVRYYPAVMFFTLTSVYFFMRALRSGPQKWPWIAYIISGALLFSSQYFYGLAIWVSMSLFALLRHRDSIKKTLLAHAFLLFICLPYLFWMLDTPYAQSRFEIEVAMGAFFVNMAEYFAYISDHIFHWLLLIPFLLIIFLTMSKHRFLSDAHRESCVLLFGISLLSLIGFSISSEEQYMRYACGVIPLLMLLAGRILSVLSRVHITLGLAGIALLIYSNGNLGNYITKELATEHIGPVKGIIGVLERESEPGDEVLIAYGDLPVKFYLPQLKVTGGHTGEQPVAGQVYDFMIPRRNALRDMDYDLTNWIQKEMGKGNHEMLAIQVPDLPYENRETPTDHIWETQLENSKRLIVIRKK